jgi:transcriptional antiterminator NusG
MGMTQPTPVPGVPQAPPAPEVFVNRIFAIKTTSKQERTVADNILKAIDTKATDVKVTAIIVPNELQGYVLIETPEKLNGLSSSWRKLPMHVQ